MSTDYITILWFVLSAMLSLLVGVFLAAPLFEPITVGAPGTPDEHDGKRRLVDAKDRIVRSLKDLEHDHKMGKVSSEDFERASQELSGELAQVLENLRRHG
jgi:hypothetical protein